MKILVVDDEEQIRDLYKEFLKKRSIEQTVTYSCDGIEALMKCVSEKFDLIILDHKMPRMNGCDLLTVIRGGGMNKETPVIMISGEMGKVEFAPVILPETYFLQKPVSFQRFDDVLNTVSE